MRFSDSFSISLMCKVLNVSRSSFYHYFYYSSHFEQIDQKIIICSKILSIFINSKKTYGSPRITAVLNKEGFSISSKTVAKYMKLLGLVSISKAFYPKKKNSFSEQEKSKIVNLIKNLDIYKPNLVWTTDITYIKTINDGWVYLSSIIDLFSRKVIAWNVGTNMKVDLVIETLNNAFISRDYPSNVIIHSDKGAQYRSHAFRSLIANHNCLFSYTSLKHSCDENANQESFHATIKKECLYLYSFSNINEVKRACFEYIEGFYNPTRIHSALGYISPNNFEFNYFLHIPPLITV